MRSKDGKYCTQRVLIVQRYSKATKNIMDVYWVRLPKYCSYQWCKFPLEWWFECFTQCTFSWCFILVKALAQVFPACVPFAFLTIAKCSGDADAIIQRVVCFLRRVWLFIQLILGAMRWKLLTQDQRSSVSCQWWMIICILCAENHLLQFTNIAVHREEFSFSPLDFLSRCDNEGFWLSKWKPNVWRAT